MDAITFTYEVTRVGWARAALTIGDQEAAANGSISPMRCVIFSFEKGLTAPR